MIYLGRRLADLRKDSGYTQKQIAEYLKVDVRSYQRYESNDRELSLEQLVKIAVFFNVSTDYLLGKTDIKN